MLIKHKSQQPPFLSTITQNKKTHWQIKLFKSHPICQSSLMKKNTWLLENTHTGWAFSRLILSFRSTNHLESLSIRTWPIPWCNAVDSLDMPMTMTILSKSLLPPFPQSITDSETIFHALFSSKTPNPAMYLSHEWNSLHALWKCSPHFSPRRPKRLESWFSTIFHALRKTHRWPFVSFQQPLLSPSRKITNFAPKTIDAFVLEHGTTLIDELRQTHV